MEILQQAIKNMSLLQLKSFKSRYTENLSHLKGSKKEKEKLLKENKKVMKIIDKYINEKEDVEI